MRKSDRCPLNPSSVRLHASGWAPLALLVALGTGAVAGLVPARGWAQSAPAQAPAGAARATPTQAKKSAARPATGQPPLIDRELFFGDPELSALQISPDGKYLSFLKPYKGTRNVWVKGVAEPFDRARPITADTKRPVPGYFWTRDSHAVLFVQDQGGDENYNVYAVDPAAPPSADTGVPAARNLTDAKGVRAAIFAVPKSDPDVMYVGLNDRDPAWHDLYRVRLSTGERTLLRKNTDRVTNWVFDHAGQLRLATRAAENGDNEVLRVDEGGLTKIASCSVLEICQPIRFDHDNARVYMVSNAGAGDLSRLVLFDPATGKETLVESDPLGKVDFGDAIFSDATEALVATQYEDDRERTYFKDKAFEADYRLLESKLPRAELQIASSTRDDRIWVVSARSDVEPGMAYLFDRGSKALTPQYRLREKLPREPLVEMKSVRYASSDGLEIPAYLALPKGVAPKNLPAIIFPHGGPWARDTWGYSGAVQFLANRGYAVLQPNFRGSTGFGKKFVDAGNREWGQKMQDDVTWGAKYLVSQGIADPKRIGIFGGSYGGYATLAGVAFTPDVYSAAVCLFGPSNLITLLQSIPPYWEAGRRQFTVRMGDPATPEGRAQLQRQSPLSSADKIRTPLLIAQGANDPRVKKAESDQIVVALRDRSFPVEYLVFPDEGHGFARPINSLAAFTAAERFFAKHLGGRVQESVSPEVSTRLSEVTVDPKTVTLQTKVDPGTVALPAPVRPLQPFDAKYVAHIEAGPQKVDLTITTAVTEAADGYVATETAASPMGEAVDRTVLDKKTLTMRERSIKQGPMSLDAKVNGTKLTGTMKVAGGEKPIDVDLGGPLFADGAGSHAVLATLPLAPGYKTTFRNFDVMTQSPKVMQFAVTGTEQVTVPAGTFETFKGEITSDDGSKTTLWIRKEDGRVVKAVSVVPRMNGATITSELQP